MAHSNTWNAAFEAAPADTDDVGDGASEIREKVLAIRERMAVDHYFDIAGTDADHGEHLRITFHAQSAPGSPGANKAYLYTTDVSSKAELHYKDEDDNVVQLTDAGLASGQIPTGEIILFESNTAVTGFTLLTTKDDYLVYIGSGSEAAGLTGAADRSDSTWTQPTHIHTMPTHFHQWYNYVNATHDAMSWEDDGETARDFAGGTGWTYGKYLQVDNVSGNDVVVDQYTYRKDPGDANANGTANTWRPLGYVFTRQEKD